MIPKVPIDEPVVIGQSYLIPCIRLTENAGTWGTKQWWPVRGPKHDDALLNFKAKHYHLDFRFLSPTRDNRLLSWQWANGTLSKEEAVQGRVIQVSRAFGEEYAYESAERRLVAHRPGLDFPATVSIGKKLRDAYSDSRLKADLICPHKGAPLAPTADAEGIAVCPLHGLCWNIRDLRMATVEEEATARARRNRRFA